MPEQSIKPVPGGRFLAVISKVPTTTYAETDDGVIEDLTRLGACEQAGEACGPED